MGNIKKLVIVQHSYGLTKPQTQRMLAAAKIYVQEGLDVVFIISSDVCEPTSIGKIRFIQIEENRKRMFTCFCNFVNAIKLEYSDDAAILFDGTPLYSFLFSSTKYNVFSEITEIPYFGHKPSFVEKVFEKVRFYAISHFSGIQVISNSLKDYYSSRGVENIEVVNMFVDTSRFDSVTKYEGDKYIGYCGTLSLYKDGVDDLIRAFAIFDKKHSDFKLKLFGGFESEIVEKKLRRIVSDLGIEAKVIFTGRVSSENIPQLLKDATILALARPNNKQAQYGFPTKLGEYLATGNPVVVTCVGDIPSFLIDGKNAYLAIPGCPEAFASKLCEVVDEYDRAISICQLGRKLVDKDFSSKVQVEKSLSFINSKCV